MLIDVLEKKRKKRKEKTFGDWRMGKCNNICSNRCDINSYIYNSTIYNPHLIYGKVDVIGDYLLVSKLSYGPNVPNTPLSIPFMHNVLLGSDNKPSYSKSIQLGYNRLPGFDTIKNNEIVVFNYPVDNMQENMPLIKKQITLKDVLGSQETLFKFLIKKYISMVLSNPYQTALMDNLVIL